MTRFDRLTLTTLMAAGALALQLTATSAVAGFVDCANDPPGTIQQQLFAGETGITIRGTCVEDIFVINDGTFFSGDFETAGPHGIAGQIIMDSVQRVGFRNLFLEGPIFVAEGSTAEFHGIRVTGPGDFSVFNNSVVQLLPGSAVEDKDGWVVAANGGVILMDDAAIRNISGGVFIANGSNVQMNGGEIVETVNGVQIVRGSVVRLRGVVLGPARDDSGASCAPLCVGDNSDLRLDSTQVSGKNDNPAIGGVVTAFRNSSLLIRGNSSIINEGTQPAIGLFLDSSVRQDGGDGPVPLTGGITLFGASYGDFRNAVIFGDANVELKSIFRLRSTDPGNPSVLNGNVTLSKGSTMDATSPQAIVNGDVICDAPGSVLYGSVGGTGKRMCLGKF